MFWLDGVAVGPTPPQPNHRERLQGLAQHKGEAQRRQDAQIAASSLIAIEIDLKLPPEGAPIALKANSMRCRISLSPVEILIHLPFVKQLFEFALRPLREPPFSELIKGGG